MARLSPRTWLLLIGGVALLAVAGAGVKVWLDRSPGPDVAPTVDGLTVLSVRDVLEARSNGGLRDQAIALGGYWSALIIPHTCVPTPPDVPTPGELEIRCNDGEFGITELNERIMTYHTGSRITLGVGPHLTPYMSDDIAKVLFDQPLEFGPNYPPVPIVVIGHFDDPRSADCQPEALQLCRDRLVIDRIAVFDRSAVQLPPPTLGPTPFASGEEPAALLGPEDCYGDVDYSFVGWTTKAALGFDEEGQHENVYAMVTRRPCRSLTGQDPTGPRLACGPAGSAFAGAGKVPTPAR